MGNSDKKQYFLDVTGLISIGLILLGYVLFGNSFAEQHIQFSFLDFPVFIGEILLFVSLLLFLAKCKNNPQRLTRWHYVIIGYFAFVIFIKALYGYLEWGPLALRHAALLYYPVFAVFGYSFYNKKIFSTKIVTFLFLTVAAMLVVGKFNDHWTLTVVVLGFILIRSYPHKIIKFLMLLFFLAFIPYKQFFYTERMMIVSNFVSGVFLAVAFSLILKGKKKFKFMVGMIIVGIIFLGVFNTADHNSLRSIINFKHMAEVFNEASVSIAAGEGEYNAEYHKEVKLYHSEKLIAEQAEKIAFEAVKLKEAIFEEVNEGIEIVFAQSKENEQEFSSDLTKAEMRQSLIKQIKEKSAIRGRRNFLKGQVTVETRRAFIKEVKAEIWLNFEGAVDEEASVVAAGEVIKQGQRRNHNAVFRIFIWRDMIVEFMREKPIIGFDFGKPFRSKSLEILHWGDGDWVRDGWIAAHNSYLHIIYRMGIVGIVFIFSFLVVLFRMIRKFILMKSVTGILLCGIIINWFVAAHFLTIFELPYTAIPIWTLFGLTYAYFSELRSLTND